MMKSILIILLFPFVFSCALMSQNECQKGNWYEIGFNDAKNGIHSSHFKEYKNACLEYSINADQLQYHKGYDKGVLEYCTPENGYEVGRIGNVYNDVCPDNLEKKFLPSYEMGRKLYEIKESIQKDISLEEKNELEKLMKHQERDELQLIHDNMI